MHTLIYISHWRFPSDKTMSPLILKTCEMFARRGLRVELWVPWRHNPGFSRLDPFFHHGIRKNFVIHRLPAIDLTKVLPGSFGFFVLLFTFNVSVAVRAFFYRKCYGLLFYLHDFRDAFFLPLFRSPIFIEIHDFYRSSLGWLSRSYFSRISGFVVTNDFKMQVLKRDFFVSSDRLLHQPNAVDIEMFRIGLSQKDARAMLKLPAGKKLVIYTGHLFSWKGVDTLLAAAEYMPDEAVIYFVGGTDEDVEKFKIQSSKLKNRNVVIVGRRPHQEIPLWLRAADVLVLPNTAKEEVSRYETSPVKLFEYLASGTPIVASDLPSIRNIVTEKEVFFFEPDSAKSLADTVLWAMAREKIASDKSVRGKRVAEKSSWEQRTEAILSFLKIRLRSLPRRPQVLVLGGDGRSTLATVRSLGEKNIEIVLGVDEPRSIVAYSRFVSRTIQLPSSARHLSQWKSAVSKLIEENHFDFVIPCTEGVAVPLTLAKDQLSRETKVLVPGRESFLLTYEKDKTVRLAEELGIPVPRTRVVRDLSDLDRAVEDFNFPVALKPNSSKHWDGDERLEFSAKIAKNTTEVHSFASLVFEYMSVVVQEYVLGRGVGQEFLCKDGKIILSFQHERIHEPEGSGGSSYRKSVPVDKGLLSFSERLIQALHWSGPIMVEYRQDPGTGRVVLLEVNGRLWGSLPLTVRSGVDIPYAAYELFAKGRYLVETPYRTEVYVRNLVNDLRWFYDLHKNKNVVWRILLLNLFFAKAGGRLLLGREKWDTFMVIDPLPAVAEFGYILASVFQKFVVSIRKPWVNKSKKVDLSKVKQLLALRPSILFVCGGNIVRSPFAEYFAKKRMQEEKIVGVEVRSSGFYPEDNRTSPTYARAMAGRFGVSLAEHRSSVIDEGMVKKAGIILYMDGENRKMLRDNFPWAEEKIFPLGAFTLTGEISDPWGKSIDIYADAYDRIAKSIDIFLDGVLKE